MIKIKEADKIKSIFRRVGGKIFRQPFYLFACLLLVDLVIGGLLFWQNILSPKSDVSISQPSLILNKANLDKFIQDLTAQEEEFQNNSNQKPLDIFVGFKQKSLVSLPSATSSTSSSATSTQVK